MRIAFWGNFGALNLGNECTLAAAVYNFRVRLPQAELLAICREPADVVVRHGIGAIPMSQPREPYEGLRRPNPLRMLVSLGREVGAWVRAFLEAGDIDALLVTGSGILSDEGEGTLGLPYELFKWSLVTKLRRKKLFFVSVGAESLTRRASQGLVKGALRLADYRSYRDSHSVRILQGVGFQTEHDVVRPDLAFSLPRPPAGAAGLARAAWDGTRQRRVAVGLFNYRGRGVANAADAAAYQVYLDRICSLILWLLGRGDAVRVVLGDFAYDEKVRLDVRAELARRGLDLTNPAFIDTPAESFEQLVEQLGSVDFVIASRYHNVVLGLLLAKPVVSLSYEPKHNALMRDMGLGEYCQPLDDFTLDRLAEQLLRLEANATALSAVIAERTATNRARLAEQYDLIVRTVCGSSAERRREH
jgi:polysaccharide pyruvyl transferase WcaK-like protein